MRINRSIISNFNPDADVTFGDGVTISSFAGTGDRMVIASSTGVLATQAIPGGTIGGSGTTNYIPKFTGATTLGNSLIYDSGTNVGIGTTSPDAKLRVAGTANGTQAIFTQVDGRGLEISTSLVAGTNDAGSVLNARGDSSGTMIFQTESTERMRITSGGNVGIAITSPTNALHIGVDNTLRVEGSSASNDTFGISMGGSGSFKIDAPGVVGGRFAVLNSTNVLIGTTTDNGSKLQVSGSATFSSSVSAKSTGTTTYGLKVDTDNSSGSKDLLLAGVTGFSNGFTVQYTGTEMKYLFIDGKVGIGTTSPSEKLEVNGNIKTAAPTGYTAQPWKLGAYTAGGITPDGYILVEINGNIYTIPALAGTP